MTARELILEILSNHSDALDKPVTWSVNGFEYDGSLDADDLSSDQYGLHLLEPRGDCLP